MNSKRNQALVFLILAAVALILGWRDGRAMTGLRSKVALVSENRDRLDSDIEALNRRNQVVSRRLDEERRDHAATTNTHAGAKEMRDQFTVYDQLAADPRMQVLRERSYIAAKHLNYLPLYRSLGLSATQIEGFEAIVGEYFLRSQDIDLAIVPLKIDETDPDVAALHAENRQGWATAEAALLGDAVFKQVQAYDAAASQRAVVNDVTSALLFSAEPLTADQSHRLMQTLAGAQVVASPDGYTPAQFDWEAVQQQASAYLSPNQAAELASSAAAAQNQGLTQQYATLVKSWVKSSPSIPQR